MNPFSLISREFKAIDLGTENQGLHDQLQQAVKENRTLRHVSGQENGKSVSYLRERTWTEFGQETWDRIFGKGEIAAAAKAEAWAAVHQALNGKIASIRVPQISSNDQESAAASSDTDCPIAQNKLLDAHFAVQQAVSEARRTAQTVYPHIFGVKLAVESISIVSERITVRLCDKQSFAKACAFVGGTDALVKAAGKEKKDGGYDFLEKASATACIQALYKDELMEALKSAKENARFVSIPYRYQPGDAQGYGYGAEAWKAMHASALQQAIDGCESQKTIVILVDDASTFTNLRTTLTDEENNRLMPLYKRTREVVLDSHRSQSA